MGTAIYSQAQEGAEGAEGAEQPADSSEDDDVVDAEIVDEDEEKK